MPQSRSEQMFNKKTLYQHDYQVNEKAKLIDLSIFFNMHINIF